MASCSTPKELPLVLSLASERLERLISFSGLAYTGQRCRSMRRERIQAILTLLPAMLKKLSLQHQGTLIRLFDKRQAVPLTVKELAAAAGLPERRTKRCLEDLKSAGLLDTQHQWKRAVDGGKTLLVAPCLRRLTRKFWACMGLWGLFVESVRYMQGRQSIVLKTLPLKISIKKRGHSPSPLPDAEISRLRSAAFLCLVRDHGGQLCACPHCSPQQQHICQNLAQKISHRG